MNLNLIGVRCQNLMSTDARFRSLKWIPDLYLFNPHASGLLSHKLIALVADFYSDILLDTQL